MITVHKLNGDALIINADLIECLDIGAQTVVHLATGNKFIVKESSDEVVQKVVEYKKRIHGEDAVVNPIKSFVRKNV